jgi:hypothetical protein
MANSLPPWTEVALSVYELHGTSAINLVTSATGLGGAYHVAVTIYGLEWSYGFSEEGTGVYMVHVGQSTLGNFLERVPLGRTRKSPEDVLDILDQLRKTWNGQQYDVLAKNCAHFSVAFVKRLGFSDVPQWVNSLAGAGAALTGAQPRQTIIPQEDLDAYDDDELQEFADDGDQMALVELVWRHAQEYTLDWVEKAKHRAKFEDHCVEFRWSIPRDDDGTCLAVAEDLTLDLRLKRAIAQAIAIALGLQWNKENDDIPVNILKIQMESGMRVNAAFRVVGGHNISRISRSLNAESFAHQFRKSVAAVVPWSRIEVMLISSMVIETVPGQPSIAKRVQTSSGYGGEVCFSRTDRRDFPTPDSSKDTLHRLQRLQNLRDKMAEQTSLQHSLDAMQRVGSDHRVPCY